MVIFVFSLLKLENIYSCMSLYKRWPLINFYTYKKIREIFIPDNCSPFGNCIPVWVYISDGHRQISIPFHFFTVKSSCALVTRGEMVISSQARFLPGRKLPFPPRWRVRMTISRKKIEISFGHRLYRLIQE